MKVNSDAEQIVEIQVAGRTCTGSGIASHDLSTDGLLLLVIDAGRINMVESTSRTFSGVIQQDDLQKHI